MKTGKLFFSLLFLTSFFSLVLAQEQIDNVSGEEEEGGTATQSYSESFLKYNDNFPMKVIFNNNLPSELDMKSVTENNDIHLDCNLYRIENGMAYLEAGGFYNLNSWANNFYSYESWDPEKKVDVILFLFDGKNKRWVGGDMDNVVLGTVMGMNFENIYSAEVYKTWPRMKKRITENTVFKVCLYDRERNQRSNFVYSPGATTRLLNPVATASSK